MVNIARGMGLGGDSPGRKSKASANDKKVGDASALPCRAKGSYQTNREKEMERERLWEDWKLLTWWDIMFYDLCVSLSSVCLLYISLILPISFIADSLGHQPCISSYTYTKRLPGCASDVAPPPPPVDMDNDGFDSEDEELEYSYRHDPGHGMAMQQDNFDGRSRYLPTMNSSVNGSGVTQPDEEAYFGARCRCLSL